MGAVMAASYCSPSTPTAAADVDVEASCVALPRCSASQPWTCVSAWGWLATDLTCAIDVPGRTSNENLTGSTTSATATNGSSTASASIVAETAPSTEFSTGTHARSARP